LKIGAKKSFCHSAIISEGNLGRAVNLGVKVGVYLFLDEVYYLQKVLYTV